MTPIGSTTNAARHNSWCCNLIFGVFIFLMPHTARAACDGQWNLSGDWLLVQNNGAKATFSLQQSGNVISGSGAYPGRTGKVTGSIQGDGFFFVVDWRHDWVTSPSFETGQYTGTVDAQGRIAGSTFDMQNPTSRALWHGNRTANCIVAQTTVPPEKPGKVLGRVKVPGTTTPTSPQSICDRARSARERNSPAAPGLEAQCLASKKPVKLGKVKPSEKPATQTATVTGDVDVYDAPGGAGKVIGMLRKGMQVPFGSCRQDRWCQVTGVGWVWGDFLAH